MKRCANPECSRPFEYGEGRFFRFPVTQAGSGKPANSHGVRHLWLCKSCADTHTLQYRRGRGVEISLRFMAWQQLSLPRITKAA